MRIGFFVVIILVVVVGLVWIWPKRLPQATPQPAPPPAGGPVVTPVVPSVPLAETPPVKEPIALTADLRSVPAGMICGEQNAICIASSTQNILLTNPITVTGTAVAFENQFSWELDDAKGGRMEQGSVVTKAPDAGQPGDFQIRAFYADVPSVATGTLVLYEASAKDGRPIHALRIPVRLPTSTQFAHLYLAKNVDGNCLAVQESDVPIVKTSLPIEASLQRLLSIMQDEENEMHDLINRIPNGTTLIGLAVSHGTAKAVFSPELDSGDACRTKLAHAQIEATLKQFSSVNNVVISIQP